ncbi:MAG: DNA polymerase III subunit gamma/tau [Christensenellaceae bacterium]|jgi:DNA polymerase-3 subunit gamma/tau|nr:DNA polymerase III subunit gamma/tau [Christensenellaceae bacterium]
MARLALYREFRPKKFDDVIGQDHIVKTLINQIERGAVGHAYLFAGTRGTGKTSCAKIFSRAINCAKPEKGSPCGKCQVCKNLESDTAVDILEIDAASNNGVDAIRELREKVKYPPIHGKYRVYIIDEVHMLSDSAFNALLKTLEEPPSHAIFILATTEVHKLPATILSRCMRFDFRLVSNQKLEALLKKVFEKSKIECDQNSIQAIATAGEGSVRDTLSIADCVSAFADGRIDYETTLNVLGLSDKKIVSNLAGYIIEGNIGAVLDEINAAYLAGKNLIVLTKDLTVHFRNLLTIKTCKDAKGILREPVEIYEKLSEQANKVESNKLLEYMTKLSQIENDLKYALNPRVLVEIACLECASLLKKN